MQRAWSVGWLEVRGSWAVSSGVTTAGSVHHGAGRNALQERVHHVIELVSSHLKREREGWKGGGNKNDCGRFSHACQGKTSRQIKSRRQIKSSTQVKVLPNRERERLH